MNPGPAPRPPTGPRLNLTPATSNLPGNSNISSSLPPNMSSMSINSPITRTTTNTYQGSTVSLPLARQQTGLTSSMNFEGMGGVSIIKEGMAQVKEGKTIFAAWKQRNLVLRRDTLDVHKERGGKLTYQIILKDVIGVSRVESAGTIFEIRRNVNGTSTNPGDDEGLTRTMQIKVKSDDDLYEWIDFIYARCPGMGGVSNPTNFNHTVHVGYDPKTGGFVGLPPEWSKLLNSSAITKEDYEANPQAVFEVLEFYSDITKRNNEPQTYPSLTPTPSVSTAASQSKQLGYGGGASVAPPRQQPTPQRNNSYGPGQIPTNGTSAPRQRTPPESVDQQRQQMQQMATNYVSPEVREEQRQKQLETQRKRDREEQERRELERRELEAYNAMIPKTKTPMAQQEIGGGGYRSPNPERYNPSRAAPPAPGNRQEQPQPQSSLRAQRQAPSAPTPSNARPAMAPQQNSYTSQQTSTTREQGTPRTDQAQRTPEPRYQNGPASSPSQQSRAPQQTPASRLPAPVNPIKPLNVPAKTQQAPTNNGIQQNDAVKAAEAALSKPAERKQDVRMSTMSENEVMAKLKEAVSKNDPNLSYSKQKKIGQGASGSVYVAKVKENAVSPVAREVYRQQGGKAQVAIKQMDLAHQPRKELIVNEIMVMKDSKHANIVNFLDAFLRSNNTELWVVMEYMEGGALTDVIDNNTTILEDQISTICLEVCVWVWVLILC